jgi:hypothetical protein
LNPDTELPEAVHTFQVDMASELDGPFEFPDMLVCAVVGYGTATVSQNTQRVPAGSSTASRTHPTTLGSCGLQSAPGRIKVTLVKAR